MLDQAMVRGGFRCMVMGTFDLASIRHNTELQKQNPKGVRVNISVTPILGGLATQDIGEENTEVRTIAAESSITILTLYPDGSYR